MEATVGNAVQETLSPNTQGSEVQRIYELQLAQRQSLKNEKAGQRIKRLKRLKKAIWKHRANIQAALQKDLNKHPSETDLVEIYPSLTELRHAIAELADWMRPKEVGTPLAYMGSNSKIVYEPKGVCLNISPWNYPFFLSIEPLVAAISAGNTVMMKPSEFTPATSALLKQIMAELFDESEVAVIEGDHTVSQELLKLKFDHIHFTGSPRVGKIIMEAAARHLTSVTLELGGKSPTIIDETAAIKDAAHKIAWGKTMNSGQVCVAPDYLLVHRSKLHEFVKYFKQSLNQFYEGKDPMESGYYCRIINSRNLERIKQLMDNAINQGAKMELGGELNAAQNYFGPTLLSNVPHDSEIMQEEIFGPVLPMIVFDNLQEAVDIINAREKPLAMYIFSTKSKNREFVLNNTSAGSTAINEVIQQLSQPNLPFGGVNHSGIGKGHGHWGFLQFSNERSVLKASTWFGLGKLVYPPYKGLHKWMIEFTMKYF